MNLLQRTLTTLGLAVALGSCGAANTNVVRYEHGGIAYIVQHETGMSVPDMSHINTQRRAIDFAEDGRLPEGFGMMGHLHADGTDYGEDDEGPRYDAVAWVADTNGDGNPDLFHMIVNTQITIAPTLRAVGRSIHVQVIVQDVDYDGNADRRWIDGRDSEGRRGPDGTYDELQVLHDTPMQTVIDNLVWYRERTTPTQPRLKLNALDITHYYIDQ